MSWRKYTPDDKDAVEALFKRQAQKLGLKFPAPELDKAPIVMVMVQEVDGVIKRAYTVEATAEVCVIADEPIPASEMQEAVNQTAVELFEMGFKLVRAAVPAEMCFDSKRGRPSAMRRFMKKIGFTQENSLEQFYRWL